MASTDLRRLRPSELLQLLNSTPLGEVIRESGLRRDRARAGLRIGDGRRIDFFRYLGWRLLLRHQAQRIGQDQPAGYQQIRRQAAARSARVSRIGRDIAPLPEVADPNRREAAEASLRVFCESYFPEIFHLPFSDDHLRVIAKIEEAVLRGGLFAVAMPRGSGKTSLAETACLWAILIGARRFVLLIGSDESHAVEMLESIKTEAECNDLLLAEWPEAIYPIRELEGIAHRCKGQLFNGKRTRIGWTQKQLVLPTMPGSKASGAILRVRGLTGRIRGMKHVRADGKAVRPSLVILDDPQTDESARSPSQCAKRENILAGSILGLAGPGRTIAAIMPCTVIHAGDMADNILDRKKHPEWEGERTKLIYSLPGKRSEKLWDEYAGILREASGRPRANLARATKFYRQHQEAMDRGAKVAWPARYNKDEISAVQHAMNLKLRDEATFLAEMQNDPEGDTPGLEKCTADQIAAKLNGRKRGEVPKSCQTLTMMIDVHDKLLYWIVAAWEETLSGYVLDYGTYPEQKRSHFSLREARITLSRKAPGHGKEAAVLAGLKALTDDYLARQWQRDDGAIMRIDRCLIDAGYLPDVVESFIRCSGHAAVIMPSRGFGLKAANKPFSEYRYKRGDKRGYRWRIPSIAGTRQLRTIQMDVNYWKSWVHSAFATALGDPGCLSVFGRQAAEHRLLAEQVADSEYFVRTSGRGREVDEWQQRPGRPDNHFFDCQVGVAVAASLQGCRIPGTAAEAKPRPQARRKRVKYF